MAFVFNGVTKVISITLGTTDMSVRDLWSKWVEWLAIGDNSKYEPAMDYIGGDPIDPIAGTFIPIYLYLQNGWRIRPQEADHTLDVGDGILLVQGGGDPFLDTIGDFVVRINYQQPVQAISFATSGGSGSGGLTPGQDSKLTDIFNKVNELWLMQGLDPNNPAVTRLTSIEVGNIEIEITGDQVTNTTLTRK